MFKKMFLSLVLSLVLSLFAISFVQASPFMVGNTQTLFDSGYFGDQTFDRYESVQELINLWNNDFTNVPRPIPDVYFAGTGTNSGFLSETEYPDSPEIKSGSMWQFSPGTEYVTFKYDSRFELWHLNAAWDSFTVDNPLTFGEFSHALSHTREWTTTAAPVPEPATLFLMGTGLIGIGGLLRRKKTKSNCLQS